MPGDTSALAAKLTELGYVQIFQGGDEGALDALWNEPGAPEALARLAVDSEAPALARFLAAEVMFYKQNSYPREEQKRQLASVYAKALAENFTGAANTWGLPQVLDGFAGEHFLRLGESAVPELINLLADHRRLYYEGSQEATLGASCGYRVKDLAAFYLSRIKGFPLDMDQDSRKRDLEIERVKNSLY